MGPPSEYPYKYASKSFALRLSRARLLVAI
jgi:hypothetical protein